MTIRNHVRVMTERYREADITEKKQAANSCTMLYVEGGDGGGRMRIQTP